VMTSLQPAFQTSSQTLFLHQPLLPL